MKSDQVEDDEKLGRGVFSSDNASGKGKRSFFVDELTGCGGELSVDRLTYADITVLSKIHDDGATKRGANRQFYGWYAFTAALVRSIGLDAIPSDSTNPENRWHASLLVPQEGEALVNCVNKISAEAEWEPRALSSQIVEYIEQLPQP